MPRGQSGSWPRKTNSIQEWRHRIPVRHIFKRQPISGAVNQLLLDNYAADLAERVKDETLAVSYAQNLIVSANTTLEALRQDKTIRIESPASWVGKRQTVRTRVPDGMDWSDIDRLVARLRQKNQHRAAVIVLLCRSFGIRLREAILANLPDWQRQARELKQIDIREGTKGGRGKEVERWVTVSERGRLALREAVHVKKQLGGQNLLKPDENFDDLVNDGEVHRARKSCTNSASRVTTNSVRPGPARGTRKSRERLHRSCSKAPHLVRETTTSSG